MHDALRTQRLVALCIAAALLLNFPLLALWDAKVTLFGLPLLPLALFAGWALVIGLAAWIVETEDGDDEDDARSEGA
jgi:hypothetical protein